MAERILLTPVPASYSRHTSRFLSLYTLTLPFVLVHQLEIFTAPVLGIVCWGLFSMYAT
jgi:putative membrane protein